MLDYGLNVATVGPAGVQELTAAESDSTRLVQECAALFFDPLIGAVHTSVNATNDLFGWAANVSSVDVAAFRAGRSRWLDEFERALNLAYEQRLAGRKRAARRPDGDAGDAGIRLLEASEQEAQIALVKGVRKLHRSAHREVSALNPRIALLLGEAKLTDTNNPFAPPYVLDAIGTSARTIYPESHAWRALMERVVADVTPVLFRIYVAQNRFLADHGVLPDIKALLRSRSAFRPAIDRDLVAAFRKLQSAAKTHQSFARPVRASELELAPEKSRSPLSLATETTAPSPVPRPPRHELPRAANTPSPDARLVADVRAAIAILVEKAAAEVPQAPTSAISNLETSAVYVPGVIDRERASDALIGILGRLAQLDLRSAIADAAPAREGKTLLPSRVPANVVPDLRAVLAARIPSPEHGVVFDLVGHVFDAIWCDLSLPPPLHAPFERLQLPLLQVALADRDFFGNPEHPARRALNGLGAAAIGATDDAEYLARLLSVAQESAARSCASGPPFELFEDIAAAVHSFIEADRKRTSRAGRGGGDGGGDARPRAFASEAHDSRPPRRMRCAGAGPRIRRNRMGHVSDEHQAARRRRRVGRCRRAADAGRSAVERLREHPPRRPQGVAGANSIARRRASPRLRRGQSAPGQSRCDPAGNLPASERRREGRGTRRATRRRCARRRRVAARRSGRRPCGTASPRFRHRDDRRNLGPLPDRRRRRADAPLLGEPDARPVYFCRPRR